MRTMFYCTGGREDGIHEDVQERVTPLNDKPIRPGGSFVVYWSQMNRRVSYNQALAYAIEQANSLGLPVLVYEGLTNTYPYANDRLHTFILQGVPDCAQGLAKLGIGYCFYLRRKKSDRNDTFYEVARDAAMVVTDDYPTFIARKHNASVPEKLPCAYHAVDASCIVPMQRFPKREWAAYTLRPKIRRLLPQYLQPLPMPAVKRKWDRKVPSWHVPVTRESVPELVASCDIDHSVKPSTLFAGGYTEARRRLDVFAKKKLNRYADDRNEPAAHATSGLSPYLHFGHISSLEVALATLESDAFQEELIVRRELSFNFTRSGPYDNLDALPDWCRKTLDKHALDRRNPMFTREQMEFAETYDPLWNATQKELLLRGKIHGYYRMYWGKKIIEWADSHEEALDIMLYLHDRYALDGRDPNTYTSCLWCFGLHDRPWTERPIFGQIRYMSYDGMRRKTNVDAYIREIEHLERTGQDLARL